MKKLNYILFVLCLALYSCGMTDVWKEWENEGVMSSERLLPSEVKTLLCSSDGWKMTYKGVDFYFQFGEGGNLISDTDASILEEKMETNYYLDYEGEKTILLTLDGGSALKYLSEGVEETLVITAYSNQKVTAKGQAGGLEMNLTPVTLADIESNDAAKVAALAVKLNRNGVIRDVNGKFVAHYTVSEDNGQITFSVLEDRILTHVVKALNIDSNDDEVIFSFEAIVLNGVNVSKLMYDFDSKALATDSQMSAEANREAVSYFTGSSFQTHFISKNNNKGDAKEELWEELGWKCIGDVEISNRDVRPLVLCPGSENAIWYTFFDANWTVKNEVDRIYFKKTAGYMPYGGDNRVSEAETELANVLAAWFHEDGLYLVRETDGNTSYLYFLSPTTDNWFKTQQ